MEFFLVIVFFFILVLVIYISFLKMFKYAVLLMCGNDKEALSNLLHKCNPYGFYLGNRDIPLSILLEDKNTYSKFVDSNRLVARLGDYIAKFTEYSGDYEYLSTIEKTIESKFKFWKDPNVEETLSNKFPEKLYFVKLAIIIRLFEALRNIKPHTSLENWKKELLLYNDFQDDLVMRRIYISICNEEIKKNELQVIANKEPTFKELSDYLNNTPKYYFEGYVSNFFYFHKKST